MTPFTRLSTPELSEDRCGRRGPNAELSTQCHSALDRLTKRSEQQAYRLPLKKNILKLEDI